LPYPRWSVDNPQWATVGSADKYSMSSALSASSTQKRPVQEPELARNADPDSGQRAGDRSGRRIWTAEIFLVGVFLVALTTRVLVLAHPADVYLGPAILFDHLGLRIAVGQGFGPSSILPPLYPFYLSCFYKMIGYSHEVVLFSHALLGALACSAGALLVRYLGLNRRYAWMAGLLLALFPQSLAQARHLSPETLISYLFLVGIVLWTRGKPFPHYGESLGAGLVFGLVLLGGLGAILPIGCALLVRAHFEDRMTGTFGPFQTETGPGGHPSGSLQVAPTKPDSPGRLFGIRVGHLALVLFCLFAIAGAWSNRNSDLHGRAVLVDSTWALRLRAATIPGLNEIEYRVPGRLVEQPDNSPLTENAIALGEWMGFVATYPVKALKIWSDRAESFFGFSGRNDVTTLERFPYAGAFYQIAQAMVWGVALSLALAWVILLRRRGGQERVLASAVLGCIALGCVSGNVGTARIFTVPLIVALAMRGSWGVLVLSGIRLRTARSEARMLANGERIGVELLPRGVDRAGRLRWLAWIFAVLAVWIHGLSSLIE